MSLIPGTLPSDSCFGTPQEVLELFAQYLDIPAFAVSSKVLYSDTSPLPSTDFIWVDTTGSQNNVLKIYNTIASTYQEYPLAGTAGSPNTLIDGKSTIPAPLTSSDKTLVSVSGVLYRATLAELSVGVLSSGSITYPMLSTSATEANNVASRVAKAWIYYNGVTNAILADFNVSTVTDVGTGNFTVNFSSSLASSSISVSGIGRFDGNAQVICLRSAGTGSVGLYTGSAHAYGSNPGLATDVDYVSISVFSI